MLLAGFMFSFWATVALSSNEGNLMISALSFGMWMIIGQLPLYVLILAVMGNAHEKVIKKQTHFLIKIVGEKNYLYYFMISCNYFYLQLEFTFSLAQ